MALHLVRYGLDVGVLARRPAVFRESFTAYLRRGIMTHMTMQQFYFPYTLINFLLICLVMFSQPVCAEWQSFTLRNGHIVIDVEIAGHPAKAVLDGGSSGNMIRSDLVEQFGQDFKKTGKARVSGVFGEQILQVYGGIPLKLFGSNVTLNDATAGPNHGVELLLGGGFFRNTIVQIDYPNSRLRRLDKKNVDMKKQANVPMKRVRGSRFPAIQVEHNGVETWLIFDTGNSGAIFVKHSFATKSGWLNEQTKTRESMGIGIFESNTILNFSIDAFKIGPYELNNVSVNVPSQDDVSDFGKYFIEPSGTRIKTGVKVEGLIGYDVLKHFVVTIDYMDYKVNLYAPPP